MKKIKRLVPMISLIVFISLLLNLLFVCWHIPPILAVAITISFDIFVASSWDWL